MNRNVYIEARNLIANRRFADAYRMLKEVVSSDRNAEWFFLTGTAAMKMGRYEEGEDYIKRARFMDPENQEYNAAYNQFSSYRNDYDDRARYYNEEEDMTQVVAAHVVAVAVATIVQTLAVSYGA